MEIFPNYRQLRRELNKQWQHGFLWDACISVRGQIFLAHKNILLGSSQYFRTLYGWERRAKMGYQVVIVNLDIVTAAGFGAILDFMYSAHLALTIKNVTEVMSAAICLQVTDIIQACHDVVSAALNISIHNELTKELID